VKPRVIALAAVASAGLVAVLGAGRPPRDARPAPDAARAESVTMSYEVGGVQVIHHQRSTSQIVAVSLYLLGGSRQLTPATAGVEAFLLNASRYGTQAYPGEATRRALARTGSVITVEPELDWTKYSFHGLATEFDSTWVVFAERLLHPSLDSSAMTLTREKMLTALSQRTESPDGQAAVLADSLAYRGHPYAVSPDGSAESLRALTADALRRYAAEQMVTSRMLLVIVGDVSRAQVEAAVGKTLGSLPKGSYAWAMPDPWAPAKAEVAAVQRTLPTNYIRGYFAGPQRSSPDFPAFQLATGVLGSIISSMVRGQAGLSYAAGASAVELGASGGYITVSTTRPDSVMKLINSAIDTLGGTFVTVPRFALVESGKSYSTEFSQMTESSSGYAEILARAQLYSGDFRAAGQYGDLVKKLVSTDIRRAIARYVKNIQFAYIGDTTRMPRELMLKH
jgi:zinc protease